MDDLEMEHRVTAVEKLAGSNRHRIEELEENQTALMKLATSVEVMATEQGHMKTDITEIKKDVKELTSEPGKKWKDFAAKVCWAVAAAVVAFVLAKLGLQ